MKNTLIQNNCKKLVFCLLLSINLLLSSLSSQAFNPTIKPENLNEDYLEHLILEGINKVRQEQGLTKLTPQESLKALANMQTDYMHQTNRVSHYQTNEENHTLVDRARKFHLLDHYLGENLVELHVHSRTIMKHMQEPVVIETYEEAAKTMVDAWVNSQLHFKNVINPKFSHTGIKVKLNKQYNVIYVTQIFSS